MIRIPFAEQEIETSANEHLQYPHPKVQRKCKVVYLKSQGSLMPTSPNSFASRPERSKGISTTIKRAGSKNSKRMVTRAVLGRYRTTSQKPGPAKAEFQLGERERMISLCREYGSIG